MKNKKYDVRGALAVMIECRCDTESGELSRIVENVEERFFARAERYAETYCAKVEKTAASERRRLRCEKITLTSKTSKKDGVLRLEFVSAITRGALAFEKKYPIFFDETEKIFIAPKNIFDFT